MSKTKEKTPTTMSRWQKKRNWQFMLNVDHKLTPSSPTFVMMFMVVRDKTDEFSETFQTAFDPLSSFSENCFAILKALYKGPKSAT